MMKAWNSEPARAHIQGTARRSPCLLPPARSGHKTPAETTDGLHVLCQGVAVRMPRPADALLSCPTQRPHPTQSSTQCTLITRARPSAPPSHTGGLSDLLCLLPLDLVVHRRLGAGHLGVQALEDERGPVPLKSGHQHIGHAEDVDDPGRREHRARRESRQRHLPKPDGGICERACGWGSQRCHATDRAAPPFRRGSRARVAIAAHMANTRRESAERGG